MTTELVEAQQKIVDLRQRVLQGDDIPASELSEALKALRVAREAALMKPKAAKKSRKKEEADSDAEREED